jgi:hypothetical protein
MFIPPEKLHCCVCRFSGDISLILLQVERGLDNHKPTPFVQALPHSLREGSVGPHTSRKWLAGPQATRLLAGNPAGWLADPHAKNDWRVGPQAKNLHPKAYTYAFRMQADLHPKLFKVQP